ncbi:MAG: hypothetical protein H0W25_04940 [Acidimicrobiia bacterium]|nr:hypothetical protein [Acidimicrobiia bacterium]
MFERFTTGARRVVVLAQEEARRAGYPYIGTEHLLLGMLAAEGTPAHRTLLDLGVTLERARAAVEEAVPAGKGAPAPHIPFNPRAKKVLELALREALRLHHREIGSSHVGLGLIREGGGMAVKLLTGPLGVDLDLWKSLLLDGAEEETAPRPKRVRRLTEVLKPGHRRTAAVDQILGQAADVAGDDPVASHHLLIAALRDPESAASKAIAAQGLDPAALAASLADASTEGTSDEPPEARVARQATLAVDGDAVVLRVVDPALVATLGRVEEQQDPDGATLPLSGAAPFALEPFTRLVGALTEAVDELARPGAT